MPSKHGFSTGARAACSRSLRAACLLFLLLLCVSAHLLAQGRQRTLLDSNWRFQLGDHAGAEKPAYDDTGWQHIGLPHSFGIPYFGAPRFYVGYGWYRRHVQVAALKASDEYALDFDAAFQDAQVFVNGRQVGRHLGGYTGFEFNITSALHPGDNLIAVRLNNLWNPQLNPRAGEHNFNGGIYRDVWLLHTNRLHVDWYGTYVTTPGLTASNGPVHIATDVRNDGARTASFHLRTVIQDADGRTVAQVETPNEAPASGVVTVQQTLAVPNPAFWSPAHPNLYEAVTHVLAAGREIDTFHTTFGFRTISWSATDGFKLNGERYYFHGADAHQDHAGWGDAVTQAGIRRDVQMVKDAGMDFIRGSHYPHSPVFSDACDRDGVLLWEENSFWGTGGAHVEGSWTASAYPPNPADQAPFEANVERSLAEMIRIHRNHPSIIAWSMGNEVFFSNADLMPKVRTFLAKLVQETHQLDPTRPAAIGGVQRGDLDHIGDVAGYNGDGATLFINPGVPNAVTEYGSVVAQRPGSYIPGFGDLAGQPEFRWRGGQALWAAFDHGSIFSTMGEMGMIDYFRLPKREWYWYRNAYRHIPPPAWPAPGTAVALTLESNHPPGPLRADGTDDTQLIVRVVDAGGTQLSNSPPVMLRIVSGPGALPTGRSIHFVPSDAVDAIAIRDGEAAIELHAYQNGVIQLEATSPGLKPAHLTLRTMGGPPFQPGITPIAADHPYTASAVGQDGTIADISLDRPTSSSPAAAGHTSNMADDGDQNTYWQPSAAAGDSAWVQLDFEGQCALDSVHVAFGAHRAVAYQVEVPEGTGWRTIASSSAADAAGVVELPPGLQTRLMRLTFPAGSVPQVAEIHVEGSPIQ